MLLLIKYKNTKIDNREFLQRYLLIESKLRSKSNMEYDKSTRATASEILANFYCKAYLVLAYSAPLTHRSKAWLISGSVWYLQDYVRWEPLLRFFWAPLLLFLDIIPPPATKLLPSSETLYHSRLIKVEAAGVWCQSLSDSVYFFDEAFKFSRAPSCCPFLYWYLLIPALFFLEQTGVPAYSARSAD